LFLKIKEGLVKLARANQTSHGGGLKVMATAFGYWNDSSRTYWLGSRLLITHLIWTVSGLPFSRLREKLWNFYSPGESFSIFQKLIMWLFLI